MAQRRLGAIMMLSINHHRGTTIKTSRHHGGKYEKHRYLLFL